MRILKQFRMKKKITISLLFIAVLLPQYTFTQQLNHRLGTIDKNKYESLDRLLHIADSLGQDSLILSVEDIYIPSSGYTDLFYVSHVRLYSQHTDASEPTLLENLSLNMDVRYKGDITGGPYTLEENINLAISPLKDMSIGAHYFSKEAPIPYNPDVLKEVRVAIAKSQLASIATEGFLENVYLEIYVDRGRYFLSSNISISPEALLPDDTDPANELKSNEAIISWTGVAQPASYEIEWVHVPYNSTTGVTSIDYNFDINAVRLMTNQTFVPLSLIQPNGFIVIRGRSKRPILNADQTAVLDQYEYSDWSLDDRGTISNLSSALHVIELNNSNTEEISSINWQYTSSYANNGKKKEIVQYFDGSQRNRQSNTVLNDHSGSTDIGLVEIGNQSTVISGENYYDYNGEAVINVLPAPIVESKDMAYQKGINKLTTKKLLKSDYDSSGHNPSLVFSIDSAGASQYYSPNNALLGTDPQADFIPDANGYAYQRTEFLNDGSGRIKVEYGLGEEKGTDPTKGTQYAYARPTRGEIERIFGTNIGDVSFYKKDIAIDPNGVMNMSYKDIKGRTVATAISGVAEARSKMLAIPDDNPQLTENLIESGADKFVEADGAYELSFPIFVSATSQYKFSYTFDIEPYVPCVDSTICYDCRYKLTFQIIDQDNRLVVEAIDSLVAFNQSSCTSESYALDTLTYIHPEFLLDSMVKDDSIYITLSGRKSYTIIKRLEFLNDSLEVYATSHLANENCDFLNYEYFEKDEWDKIEFNQCKEDLSFPPAEFCGEILENLRQDFMLPNGHFVAGLQYGLGFFDSLYTRIKSTLGCNRGTYEGCYDKSAFLYQALSQFVDHGNYSQLMLQREALASFMVEYHPNYCQYLICQDKYEQNEAFDLILEKSKTLDEFVAMGTKQNWFSTDTLQFSWDNSLSTYVSVNTNSSVGRLSEEVLYDFDPMMQYADSNVRDTLEHYELCKVGERDGIAFYSLIAFNEFVREDCYPSIVDFHRGNLYDLYFDYMVDGCYPDTAQTDTVSFDDFMDGIGQLSYEDQQQEEERKWAFFKELYLKVRGNIMEDMISSLVCANPRSYIFDPDCQLKTDTAIYMIPGENDPDTIPIACLPINLGCKDDIETYFWNTPYAGARPRRITHKDDIAILTDQAVDTVNSDSVVALQVYELLKANLCVNGWTIQDSVNFVLTFSAQHFACDPHNYIDSVYPSLTCTFLDVNFASIQKDVLKLNKDSSGIEVPLVYCARDFKDHYIYGEFLTKHNKLVSKGYTVPVLSGPHDLDISNPHQKQYANVLNGYLALNLSFSDYYYFVRDHSPNSTPNIFGESVPWLGSNRAGEIKEAVINRSAYLHFMEMEEDSLIDTLNVYLDSVGYDSINRAQSYIGFGELDYASGQTDLYYLDGGKATYLSYLVVYNDVFNALEEAIGTNGIMEGRVSRERRTSGVNLDVPKYTYAGSNLLIDWAIRYSNGTLRVRVLSSTDSSYVDDYYYYYEPFTCFYDLGDINGFTSIEPIYDQEEMYYARLGFTVNNRDYTMVVGRKTVLATASRIGKIALTGSIAEPQFPVEEVCEDRLITNAFVRANVRYENYIGGIKDKFKHDYKAYCLSRNPGEQGLSNRSLSMTYNLPERQYTMYYYDQADNLVMTVPPGGIDFLDYTPTDRQDITAYRNGSATSLTPNHTKTTTYEYNSENQPIKQTTPNGGTTKFWYDAAGRLVLSQNAEQALVNKYAYTRYDAQSRVVENGEVELDELSGKSWADIHAFIIVSVLDSQPMSLDSLLSIHRRNDVVKTFYDEAIFTAPTDFSQENLRSRVASQAYYHNFDSNKVETNWEYATHYSYDAVGNVKSLLNDYYQAGTITEDFHRFKRLDYAYDVVSGNVLQVYYQTGESDAFYHRYEYDAENRIIKVETSRDGLIWDEDASYEYYLHGPLARTELGVHKVQGIDYTYTLDGWLKSVNAGHKDDDIGDDDEKNNIFGEDAFGFALQYHKDDYSSIGAVNNHLIAALGDADRSDLYNGNIGSMTVHDQANNFGKNFVYDQLNRIKSMEEHDINEATLDWGALSTGSNTTFYTYDPNGNITNLDRTDGESGQLMDDLQYHYIAGKDQLASVDDAIDESFFSNDIDNQASNNYTYDKVGNLTSDLAEDICQIQWFPNGKVKRIVRFNATQERPDLFFEYDALGNRVKKTVSFVEEGQQFFRSTYYARDAQGNVMSTYEERDCNYHEGDDSLGLYYYQYSKTYTDYTLDAIAEENLDTLLGFLTYSFDKKLELCDEAHQASLLIPNIEDSIAACMDIFDYLSLYPDAKERILNYNPFIYAEYIYNNYIDSFIVLMNYDQDAWIQYLIETDSINNFYGDLDNTYSTNNGSCTDADAFYDMNRDIIQDSISNSSLIQGLLALNTTEYGDIVACHNNHGLAVGTLQQWMDDLNGYFPVSCDEPEALDLIRLINAKLLAVDFTSNDVDFIFQNVNVDDFYDALPCLAQSQPTFGDMLNSILYHFHYINNGAVDKQALNPYKPSAAIKWEVDDTDGDLLKYFIDLDVAISEVEDAVDSYFNNIYLKQWDIFFSSDSTVKDFVTEGLILHKNHSIVSDAVTGALVDSSKQILTITEDLAHLANYYKLYHPKKVLLQNYYFDSLYTAIGGLTHFTPLQYAEAINQHFGNFH